jgi:hypothetical protein
MAHPYDGPNTFGRNSDRSTWGNSFNVAPTSAMALFSVEAGGRAIRLRRIVITNPGQQTTAGLIELTLATRATAGTGGTTSAAQAYDRTEPTTSRSPVDRIGGTPGSGGVTLVKLALYVPTATAAFTPLVIDFGQGGQKCPQAAILATGEDFLGLEHPGAAGAANFCGYYEYTEEGA